MRPTIAHATFTLAGLNSQNTKRAYARALDLFIQWLDGQSSPALAMNRDTILLYLDNLRDSHEQEDGRAKSPQYYAQTLAALKRLAKHMSESDNAIDYPTYAAIKGIEPAKVKRVVYGELITDDMLESLLTACLSDFTLENDIH